MNRKALVKAIAVGILAQLAMVVVGHFVATVRDYGFAVGGMLISLLAGVLYARWAREGWRPSLLGGAIAGGACALPTIGVSVALGDTTAGGLASGTVMSTIAGLAGGAIGRALNRRAA